MGFSTLPTRLGVATRFTAAVAVVAATVFAASPSIAQERLAPVGGAAATLTDGSQPVVVVTLGSLSKLMRDVNYVTGVAGQPQFGGMFSMMAGTFAQGIDLDKPIGVLVPMVNGTPQPIIALPTSDIKLVLKRLEAQTGPVDTLDDGTLAVTVNQTTLYIKQQGDHAYAAQDPSALKLAPSDPSGMFVGMGNNYDIAARLKVQQIPTEVRNVLIDQIRAGFEQAMSQQENADSAVEMAEGSIEQLEKLIREADELNFGLNINESERHIGIDFSFTALGGTELAAIYGGQLPIPSRFASAVRDDAAMYFHSASSLSPEAIDLATENLESSIAMAKGAMENENGLPQELQDKINEYLGRFTEIVTASLAEGKSDVGGMLLAGQGKFQFVMGSFTSDGDKLAEFVKDISKEVPPSANAPTFSFDTEQFSGVTMHMVEADVPPNADEARSVFGDKIRVHIGTAPKAVYVALGPGSGDLLKEFITSGAADDTGKRPIGQFNLRLLSILEFAQSVEANDVVGSMIESLSSDPRGGELNAVANSIPNGSASKVTFGEGLIKAIGAAVVAGQAAQQAAGQPF